MIFITPGAGADIQSSFQPQSVQFVFQRFGHKVRMLAQGDISTKILGDFGREQSLHAGRCG